MASEEIVESTNGSAGDEGLQADQANGHDHGDDHADVTEQVTQEVSRHAIALAQAFFFAEFCEQKTLHDV